MLNLKVSACIDAPVERVWAVLSDLAAIQEWVGPIQHAYCPAQARGVGALRVCELKQARIEETIIEWDEGRWDQPADRDVRNRQVPGLGSCQLQLHGDRECLRGQGRGGRDQFVTTSSGVKLSWKKLDTPDFRP